MEVNDKTWGKYCGYMICALLLPQSVCMTNALPYHRIVHDLSRIAEMELESLGDFDNNDYPIRWDLCYGRFISHQGVVSPLNLSINVPVWPCVWSVTSSLRTAQRVARDWPAWSWPSSEQRWWWRSQQQCVQSLPITAREGLLVVD